MQSKEDSALGVCCAAFKSARQSMEAEELVSPFLPIEMLRTAFLNEKFMGKSTSLLCFVI